MVTVPWIAQHFLHNFKKCFKVFLGQRYLIVPEVLGLKTDQVVTADFSFTLDRRLDLAKSMSWRRSAVCFVSSGHHVPVFSVDAMSRMEKS